MSNGTGTLLQVGAPGQRSVVLLLGPPKPRVHVAAQLTRDFKFDPANLLFQATAVGVRPDVLAAIDPIAALTFGGAIGTGPNGGNAAPDSLGTAQVGSVTIAPVAGVDSSAFGSGATVGGSNTVDGAGSNLADPSLGTVQAGGGNTSKNSKGTVQIGGLRLAPAAGLTTPYGVGSARRIERHRRRIEQRRGVTRHRADRRRQHEQRLRRHGAARKHLDRPDGAVQRFPRRSGIRRRNERDRR